MRNLIARVLMALSILLASASFAVGHPLHTTITDIGYRAENHSVRASIRVFADDFGRAVLGLDASAGAPPLAAVSDARAETYVRGHFSLRGADGREVPLTWCGVRRSGDLVWVCVEAAWSEPVRGLRVDNRLLFDLYHDQINIVQAQFGQSRASLLFTKGDAPKPVA